MKITFQHSASAGERASGVYYTISGGQETTDFSQDEFCVSGPEDNTMYCTSCNLVESVKDISVLVVVPTEEVEAGDPSKGYKINNPNLIINVTNASSLTIDKNSLSDTNSNIPSAEYLDYDVINEIHITHEQGFYDEHGSGGIIGGNPTNYCIDDIGWDYPVGDCYDFRNLTIRNMKFAKKADGDGNPTIVSNRAIYSFTMEDVTVYHPLEVVVDIYPGIYQGYSVPSEEAENDGINSLALTRVQGKESGALNFIVRGNLLEAKWDTVEFLTGAFTFLVTKRVTTEYDREEVYCPGLCGRGSDLAIGYMDLHQITNVNVMEGSSISIAGYVDRLGVDNFRFEATGTAPDMWTIEEEECFEDDTETKFHVNYATFDDSHIYSDIHYSIRTLETNTVTFYNNVMSKSADVSINETVFGGPVRHEVRDSLSITGSNYNRDTYYDHFSDHSYPTLAISQVRVKNDFVVSADNNDGDITLSYVYCEHNTYDDGSERPGWESSVDSKIFLLRHMSQSVIMNTVQGCNLYFKNNADNLVGDLDLSRPEDFTYTAINVDESEGVTAVSNNNNHITVFDNAAFHVVTNIKIENIPKLGFVKFNRISIDQQSGAVSTSTGIHPPEIDPLGRPGYGTSYPVNITLNNIDYMYRLVVSDDDELGPRDPEGSAEGFCDKDLLGLGTLRDITIRKETIHQNDDVNLTIQNSEIDFIQIDADSLVLRAQDLLAHEVVNINLADSSSLRIKDSRFRQFALQCYEALELIMRHSIFDGDSSIRGESESNIDMRTVLITNADNVSNHFMQPSPFIIDVASGIINLDHIKVYYGDLEITNDYGEINVVQAFPVESLTKVDIRSYYGRLNVTHPGPDFYRDLNSIVDFENESGNVLGHEYAQTDVFAFAPAPTMKAITTPSINLQPYVRSGYTKIESKHGNVTWSYANNLTISSSSYGMDGSIEFTGFDNVVAVSSIYAMGHESFAGFDVENLDFNRMYLVTVHDKSISDVDSENYSPVSLNGTTCDHNGRGEHDPFDACLAYLILPTVDLSTSTSAGPYPSLKIGSINVFMKDCSSSVLSSLDITGAASVLISNLYVTGPTNISLEPSDYTISDWIRGSVYAGLSVFGSNDLNINGYSGIYNEVVLYLSRYDRLGINPEVISIGTLDGGDVDWSIYKLVPEDGESNLSCYNLDTNKDSYASCIGSGSGSIYVNGGSSTDYNVTVTVGTNGLEPSTVELTYEVATSLFEPEEFTIAAGDRIIIDNHLFGTDYGEEYTYAYQNMSTPTSAYNNVYVIPSTAASAVVMYDTNADGFLYLMEVLGKGEPTTHKFNLVVEAALYLYLPNLDGISITTAGDNINLILSNIGTYDRIYTTSYLLANVLRAKTVYSVASMVYSLQAAETFVTNIGCVGINVNRANADVVIDADEADDAPMVVLQTGSINDLGVYSRNYKTIYDCSIDGTYDMYGAATSCDSAIVPCRDDKCEYVNYVWSPTDKYFWVGTDYNASVNNNDKMTLVFNTDFTYFKGQCPVNDKRDYGTIKCPNTPVYSQNIRFMSSVYVVGQPSITSDFEQNAFKNNRYVDPNTVPEAPVEEPGMPGWAIGLIVLACIIAAILITMFVLKLLGKESLSDMKSTSIGAIAPN